MLMENTSNEQVPVEEEQGVAKDKKEDRLASHDGVLERSAFTFEDPQTQRRRSASNLPILYSICWQRSFFF